MITKDTTFADIFKNYPKAAELIGESGLNCRDCHAASVEPLAKGLQNHGISDDEIAKLIERMNEKESE